MTAALEGVRVLSLVDGLGAYAVRVLAGLGAQVTCVEPPGGSPERDRPSPYFIHEGEAVGRAGAALYFIHYFAGARSLTLDAQQPGGRALLERLVDASDVVIDNGHLARLGFDLDDLATQGPGRAVVSVTPFGLDSPRAHWLGGDLICQSMSGMLGLFGYRGERPARFGPEQGSQMSGLAAAAGALIALFGQRRGTGGAVVDVAAQRVGALMTLQMANASMYRQFGFTRGRAPREEGLPSGLYQAADGYFALGAWRFPDRMIALLEQVGEADGLRERFEDAGVAIAQDPAANRTVRDFMARRTRAEVLELTQPAGVIGLPVHDVEDVLADPFLERRGVFVEIESPELPRPLREIGVPVHMSATPYRPGRRPPLLGEHTAEILGGLGVAEAELAALAKRGVV